MKYAMVAAYAVCMIAMAGLTAHSKRQAAKAERSRDNWVAEYEIKVAELGSVRLSNLWLTSVAENLQAEVTANLNTEQRLRESLAMWTNENFVLLEKIGYPGYVEQDDRTVTMKIGKRVIVPEWYDTVGLLNGVPLTQKELLDRWQRRDGTVYKVVPRGRYAVKKIIARSALVLLFAASYTNTGCAVVRRVQEAGELFLRLLAQAAADGFIHIYEEKEQPA